MDYFCENWSVDLSLPFRIEAYLLRVATSFWLLGYEKSLVIERPNEIIQPILTIQLSDFYPKLEW
jgi:hypothetical protein